MNLLSILSEENSLVVLNEAGFNLRKKDAQNTWSPQLVSDINQHTSMNSLVHYYSPHK